ncbi:TolC family protein [Adhaeribacter sp. BT258]|uniref:TolC family protein n=1 Tax=Adhaeribacter terrigena TaxID=2793070 RepID=A0ABS1C3Z4_9BACT|nr:TolC family protein [Adhaeribacter terrigena]MBK0404033.1 TolC family protein [Adhaeribacter terrigena]
MKHKILFLSILLVGFLKAGSSSAQEILTLEEAVRIALERNYDIRLARNNVEIEDLNVSWANAGLTPRVDAVLNDNNGIQTTRQTQADGSIRERNNARNSNLNYGAELNWTVFDGFGMFARHDQLQEFRKLSETELQQTVLTKVGEVMRTYYDLIQQKQQLSAYDSAIVISRMRLNVAQNRFTIGKAAKLAVLNAQVDLNTDTTNLLRQRELYINTKTLLNEIIGRDIATPFEVTDSIRIDASLTLGHLSSLAQQQNPSLKAAGINKRIAELDKKQVRAIRYPAVGVNSGYNFSRSESALGFATSSSGRGFTYGLSASVNLFNGGLQRRNEKIAELQIKNAQIDQEKTNQTISSQLTRAYQVYLTNLDLVTLEKNNVEISRRNQEITLDKYELGTLTPVEFRDAQLNYLNAKVRYSNAQYLAKIAEIALKEIAGNLPLQ